MQLLTQLIQSFLNDHPDEAISDKFEVTATSLDISQSGLKLVNLVCSLENTKLCTKRQVLPFRQIVCTNGPI